MKNTLKKLGVIVVAIATILSMTTTAFAATTLDTNGEQGVFTTKDTPSTQSKTLVLEKELKVYNVDEATIKAPTISYTYTIAAATVADGTTVTDSDKSGTIHDAGVTVTAPVKAGVGAPAIANSGVVAWTATDDVVGAATDGKKNVKDISIDFSSVVFTGSGIYRYEITEALTSGYAYSTSGVTETTGAHTRYVDVYVRPSSAFAPLSTTKLAYVPEDWDIYGFTCFYNKAATITEANKTTVPVKTTGFVEGTTNGTTAVEADSYYTFNVTISKTVEGDAYGAATVNFPFTVLFTNSTVSAGTIVTNGTVTPAGTDFTHNTSVSLKSGDLKGIAHLKSGQKIKYVGIPNGTSVEVYETNVATGVTYKVDTVTDGGTAVTDNAVSSGSEPASAVAQTTKAAYESKKTTITTTADQDDDTAHTVAITNTLLTISPTGVVLRIAPYALVLAAGILLFFFARRRKEDNEEA